MTVSMQSLRMLGSIAAAALLTAGCPTIEPRGAEIADKAAAAVTPAEHLELASLYEARADEERALSARHRAEADQQRRMTGILTQGRPTRWAPSVMRDHCDSLELMHARAAVENAAQGGRHRRMAADAAS